jgi:hypothetical protein
MKKNTTATLATLALAILDSIVNASAEPTPTTDTLATSTPSNSPVMYGMSRSAFGEEDVVSFLVDEVGLELKRTSADYPPTAKMMAMSTDEARQIMAYCDELKAKAEFGDKVQKTIEMVKSLFK